MSAVIQDLGRVHFIGLGGAGMSAVARVLLGRSVAVSGSDAADSRGLQALAALGAARTVAGDHRVHVLFQPHLFSRTQEFAKEFAGALSLADTVRVLDIYAAREDPVEGVTSRFISDRLTVPGGYAPDADEALREMVITAQSGDIILTVGAGDVTRFGPLLVDLLAGKGHPQ